MSDILQKKMKNARIAAIVILALIVMDFILILVALFQSNYNLFFIEGSVLLAFFVFSWVLKTYVKKIRERMESEEKAEIQEKTNA